MWKDFFYYSKSERRAISVLLVLVIVLLSGLLFLKWNEKPNPVVQCTESDEIDSFVARIRERENLRYEYSGNSRKRVEKHIPIVLQRFDPNTADSMQLRQLGLTAFVAGNVLRYRSSGGVFRNVESFSRIYGLTDSQFVALKPYITISSEFISQRDTFRANEQKKEDFIPAIVKYPEGTVVSLNVADTSQLKRVPGIGSGLARMIVAYRDRLGGFSRVEQLQEIPHIDVELNRWFRIEDGPYCKLRVNHDGLDCLRNHPYMDFYKARAILEYRRKRGMIKSQSQIAMFEEFSEADMLRLSPYFSFE